MQITFNPLDAPETATVMQVLRALGQIDGSVEVTVTDRAEAPTPSPTEALAAIGAPLTPTDTDKHGMPWNGDYHAKTKTKNADGSWKALRGHTDEAKAAIVAFTSGEAPVTTAEAPAPAGMPGMPGATVEVPRDPVSYEEASQKFMAMITDGTVTDFNTVYAAIGIKVDQAAELETNESLRVKLMDHLESLEA